MAVGGSTKDARPSCQVTAAIKANAEAFTPSKKAEAAGMDVVIVSGDKDMFQLVSDRIQVYDSMREDARFHELRRKLKLA